MAGGATITPKLFKFLRDIDQNNDRAWFAENKQRYIDEVRDPLLEFIEAVGPKLQRISPYLVADPRPNGGSLFRIYRDTRFARDKRPYKSWSSIRFPHVMGRERPAPGYYLHLEPGSVFLAAGMWRAESEGLRAIREAIAGRPDRWARVLRRRDPALDDGTRLVRPPRGFDPEHPAIEDLKRKSFTMSVQFTQAQACSPDFLARYVRACKRCAPLMEFLAEALDLKWA